MDLADLNKVVDICGLRKFLDESPDGLSTMVVDNGWRLSEGIRRRIALGRALTTNGMLAVIDEPTESLDAEGCNAVQQIMSTMTQQGKTIIVMSHDPNIVKGPHILMDLNVKPTPTVNRIGYETANKSTPVPSPLHEPTETPLPEAKPLSKLIHAQNSDTTNGQATTEISKSSSQERKRS
jgi:hypothetical protein